MAKENKTAGQNQSNKNKNAKKPAPPQTAKKDPVLKSTIKPAPKPPAPKPAPKPAAKPAPSFSVPKYSVVKPEDAASQPLFSSPLSIAILAAGAILFFAGIYFLAKIQYTHTGKGSFAQGCALLALGAVVPCVGVKQIRNYLFPRKTIDQYGLARPDGKN